MANEEEIKLVLQVQGQAEAKELAIRIQDLKNHIAVMSQTVAATDPIMVGLGAKFKTMTAEADRLDKQFGKAGAGSKNMGMAILEGSRAMEDLQYGIAGVLNNIPGLIASLGGSAGLAGIVSGVAVAATVLYRNWDSLTTLFGGSKWVDPLKTELENIKDRIEELSKIPIKLNIERVELKSLQADAAKQAAGEKAAEDAGNYKSKTDRESESATKEAVLDSGAYEAIRTNMVAKAKAQAVQEQSDRKTAYEAAKAKVLASGGSGAAIEGKLASMKDEYERNADEGGYKAMAHAETEAGKLLLPAGKGESVAEKNARLVAEARSAGISEDKIRQIEEQSPENRKAAADLEAESKRNYDLWKAQEEAKKKFEDEWEQGVTEFEADRDKKRKAALDYEKQQKQAMAAIAKAEETELKRATDLRMAALSRGAPERAAERASALNRQNGLEDRIGQASGMGDVVGQMLMSARMNQRGPRNAAELRRMQRMTLEEREAMQGKQNDAADEATTQQLTRNILRQGLTRSPLEARASAEKLVAQKRAELNGETGDPATVANEKAAKATDELTKAIVELKRDGVTVKLD
jgi:hypothetical protein